MKILLLITIITLHASLGFTQKKIPLEPAPVNFTISNTGFNVHGTMDGLQGFILLDNKSFVLTGIEGSIDPGTIQTGIELRDKHLKKADYFNVKEFPKILMASTQIRKNSANNYTGNFNLTIKDVTKNIAVPFVFSLIKNGYVLKGTFSINRLDFKLGEESMILSDNVTINIECKAMQE